MQIWNTVYHLTRNAKQRVDEFQVNQVYICLDLCLNTRPTHARRFTHVASILHKMQIINTQAISELQDQLHWKLSEVVQLMDKNEICTV